MRIAMLTNNYKPFIGGVPISIERLSDGLRALGHEVYIFAPSYENQVEEEFVIRYKSIKYKVEGGIVVPNIFDLEIEKKFKELNIDVIHVHHPMLIGFTALYLGKKYSMPVTFTYHTRYEQYLHYVKPYKLLEERFENEEYKILKQIEQKTLNFSKEKLIPNCIKYFSNKCDLVFSPTEMMRGYLKEKGTRSEIKVLPTGLDTSYFKENDNDSNKIRNEFIGNKKYLFCTISRLTKEKNIEFVIDGLKSLKNKIGDTFNTIIIGQGPLKETLEQKVKELGLEGNVVFLNSISNDKIGDYYRACDLFLFGSKSETQGIVLLEAMAAKTPVVAVKASGVVDVVKNGVNGYMTRENIEEWVGRIVEIVDNKYLMEYLKEGAYNEAKRYLSSNIAKIAERNYKSAIKAYGMKGLEYEYKIS